MLRCYPCRISIELRKNWLFFLLNFGASDSKEILNVSWKTGTVLIPTDLQNSRTIGVFSEMDSPYRHRPLKIANETIPPPELIVVGTLPYWYTIASGYLLPIPPHTWTMTCHVARVNLDQKSHKMTPHSGTWPFGFEFGFLLNHDKQHHYISLEMAARDSQKVTATYRTTEDHLNFEPFSLALKSNHKFWRDTHALRGCMISISLKRALSPLKTYSELPSPPTRIIA